MSRAADLGSSLLSKKQARDDKFRKRRESWEKRAAWAEVLVPPIIEGATDWVMTDNIREFDRNEELVQENRDSKLALEIAQRWTNLDNRAHEEYGGNLYNFYSNQDREEAERRAAEALRAEGRAEVVGPHGPYQAQLSALIDGWNEDRVRDHEEAMALVRKLGTEEEYAAIVALARKDARSDNIFGTLINKTKNWARGTTQEEVDARAIDSVVNSPLARDFQALIDFQDEYKRTQDVNAADFWTKWANELEVDEGDLYKYRTDVEYHQYADSLYKIVRNYRISLNDPEMEEEVLSIDRSTPITYNLEDVSTPEGLQKFEDDLAREAIKTMNYHQKAQQLLTREGAIEFRRRVESPPSTDEEGNITGGIGKTLYALGATGNLMEDYIRVGQVFDDIAGNEEYVKDEVKESVQKQMMALAFTEAQESAFNIAALRSRGRMSQELSQQQLQELINDLVIRVQILNEGLEGMDFGGQP